MSVKIRFEIQTNDDNLKPRPRREHEWRAIGGREGRYYLNEDKFIETSCPTIEDARDAVKRIERAYKRDYLLVPSLRIVKIEIVTTYEVVE